MKVVQVALRPTDASISAGRPALTPELLAATGARYSRSDEGLDAILSRIDPANPDKSVDSIFRMVDYGHASIADMAPVALFIDGVSLLLAYVIWSLCPVAGGQESSTRYIRMGAEGLISPDILGLPEESRGAWTDTMNASFAAYETAVAYWERIAKASPEVMRIPASLLADSSDKAKKTVGRMRRNYAFDRARYFLPIAAKTNVMMVQSARAWVTLCQHLLSHPLPEAQTLGAAIHDELALVAPRLLRHATEKPSLLTGQRSEWIQWLSAGNPSHLAPDTTLPADHAPTPYLETWEPFSGAGSRFTADLSCHDNRYAYIGESLRRTSVRFSWEAVAFAEIRDLNRHRTGTKYCPLSPVGFYFAAEEEREPTSEYVALGEIGRAASKLARTVLESGDATGLYFALLGTQFPFEHTTTADKFLYEAELRTGTGAHYRYARHLRDALALWYERYPTTRGLVLEGSAEPE